ncbi:MAG: L,D-transpeptidase [Candidatus Thiocaldithrix dubininis]|uniref:L,D-transpeptidase n=1 Tax=Candidatus Thiocaldithrix dubininis TaxID=3080823 RepID=A0AA95KIY2_9GAMM|nr:MAG: L,D-transpeptidase [Candidatus Thiocaldithrix dubininis]
MAEDLMQPLPLPTNNTPMQQAPQATPPNVAPLMQQLTARFPTQSFAKLLIVDAGAQRMYLVEQGQPVGGWVISTAANGTGSEKGSDKTPLGLHKISEKIGDGAPLGAIFKARQNTGKQVEILTAPGADSKDDYVTSRIMWLEGLEPGVNKGGDVDSKERYIYIHGTGEEGKLGTPASHGCIRMKNADVINLFNRVDENTLVYITQNLAN